MKHVDKVFKDSLYNHHADVPEGMWEKIAPAIEEKSKRAFYWYWLAGVISILLAGLAFYFLQNQTNSDPLAEATKTQEFNHFKSDKQQVALTAKLDAESVFVPNNAASDEPQKPVTDHKIVAKSTTHHKSTTDNKSIQGNTIEKTQERTASQDSKFFTPENANNGDVDTKSDAVNTQFSTAGKPAKLIITKSYTSDNGSIIEKLNTGESTKQPTYNVFINAEGLGAGALMRIVEPLENIPLPYFEKVLKKKTILNL